MTIMSLKVAPIRIQGKPIVFRSTDEGDLVGMVDGLAIGRIMRVRRQPSHDIWFWSLTSPCLKGLVAPASGQCASIPGAMAEFEAAFRGALA